MNEGLLYIGLGIVHHHGDAVDLRGVAREHVVQDAEFFRERSIGGEAAQHVLVCAHRPSPAYQSHPTRPLDPVTPSTFAGCMHSVCTKMRYANNTAPMPVMKMPSNVPAPPLEATGTTLFRKTLRRSRSASFC